MTESIPSPTPGTPSPEIQPLDRKAVVLGGIALAVFAIVAVGLLAMVAGSGIGTGNGATAAPAASSFAYAAPAPAPALELTDQDGQPFRLTDLAGRPVLVFFGYTHCPDVCPTTVGNVNQVLDTVGDGPRVVFVSVDPERDDVAAMANYMRYLPDAYIGLSGTPDEISRNAAGWGVKYAVVDQQADGSYAMAHTADLFLVDGQGRLRASFPFGTSAEPVTEAVRALLAETPPPTEPPAPATSAPGATPTPVPTRAPTPAPTTTAGGSATPAGDELRLTVVSTSIWAEPATPIIVSVGDDQGALLDGSVPVSFQVTGAENAPTGPPVPATAILPMGQRTTFFVGSVPIPEAGPWRLNVTSADGRSGSTPITAMDPGSTTPVGAMAPDVDTPTLSDVGDIKQITTAVEGQLDERLYTTSTADARRAGQPYVIVIDSNRFRTSPACGRAITMVGYLLDRWREITFVHLEPFDYQVITEEPVLSGSIENPPLNSWTRPWGIGDEVWPATEMPWIFVVDGDGVVRAKYTGVVGSADVDVIVSLITGNGVVNP
jgi:cytochrome oxidase Cu insertion factor (SCO1/SenC/PrrC family)